MGGPQWWGRALRPCGRLVSPLTSSPSLLVVFWSKKINAKVLFRLDSVWYSFSAEHKNREKQELALGSRLIG